MVWLDISKRLGEGQYDLEDLEYRGQELYQFIEESSKEYGFKLEDVIPVGFSNGSNMAINLILREQTPFQKHYSLHHFIR